MKKNHSFFMLCFVLLSIFNSKLISAQYSNIPIVNSYLKAYMESNDETMNQGRLEVYIKNNNLWEITSAEARVVNYKQNNRTNYDLEYLNLDMKLMGWGYRLIGNSMRLLTYEPGGSGIGTVFSDGIPHPFGTPNKAFHISIDRNRPHITPTFHTETSIHIEDYLLLNTPNLLFVDKDAHATIHFGIQHWSRTIHLYARQLWIWI